MAAEWEVRQFFQAICEELNIQANNKSKIELIHAMKDFLVTRHEQGHNVVLIVDEAQDLARIVLEEVRLLGNLETSSEKLLQIILVGQPELRRMIATPELRQLSQRLTVKFHLGTLGQEDVVAYIDHRMKVADGPGDVFEPEAAVEVFRASGGVPRVVNVICDQALLQTYVNDEKAVTAGTVRHVVSEMEGYYMDAPAPMRRASARVH